VLGREPGQVLAQQGQGPGLREPEQAPPFAEQALRVQEPREPVRARMQAFSRWECRSPGREPQALLERGQRLARRASAQEPPLAEQGRPCARREPARAA